MLYSSGVAFAEPIGENGSGDSCLSCAKRLCSRMAPSKSMAFGEYPPAATGGPIGVPLSRVHLVKRKLLRHEVAKQLAQTLLPFLHVWGAEKLI